MEGREGNFQGNLNCRAGGREGGLVAPTQCHHSPGLRLSGLQSSQFCLQLGGRVSSGATAQGDNGYWGRLTETGWVRDQEFLSARLSVAPGRFSLCQETTFKGDIVLSSQPCVILTLSKYYN